MTVIDDLENLERAIRWQQASNIVAVIENAKTQINKLENDVRILRWALHRAQQCLTENGNYSPVVDLLQTAENMTEPVNDR